MSEETTPPLEKTAKIEQSLIKYYKQLNCPGIIKMIEYLFSQEGQKMVSLGSSSLGLSEVINLPGLSEGEKMAIAEERIYKLHLGSKQRSETPLQTLLRHTKEWEHTGTISLPKNNGGTETISLKKFDEICGELIDILLEFETKH